MPTRIVLLQGGPRDGDHAMVDANKGLLAAKPHPQPGVDPDHVIAPYYAVDADNPEIAKFIGYKSRHEIKAQYGGYQSPPEHDPADWWKEGNDGAA